MKRRALGVVVTMLVVLTGADIAPAKTPLVPKTGWYEGGTSQHSSFFKSRVRVSKQSGRLTVELNIGVEVKCLGPAGITLDTAHRINGKQSGVLGASPRLRQNATFSLVRTIPYSVRGSMRVAINGRFRSPTRVTGTISLSEIESPAFPDVDCSGVQKITFTANHLSKHGAANKPVTPQLGLYFGQVVSPPENGTVEVHETEAKVVPLGKGRGVQVSISPFLASCSGDAPPGTGFSVLEKTPIPIRNGKFKLDRTIHPTIAGGAGTSTMRRVISGIFEPPRRWS